MPLRHRLHRMVRALPLPARWRRELDDVVRLYGLGLALDRQGLFHALSGDIEQWAPFLRFAPPGHFYSPIPRLDEIQAQADRLFDFHVEVPGIALRVDQQLELVRRIAEVVAGDELLTLERRPGARYFIDNPAYGVGDATMLRGMLRLHRPSRIVEIGSGYSSAMVLDVIRQHLPDTAVTFVEPYPDLLRSLMFDGDEQRCTIVEQRVQDLDLEVVQQLGEGDVLLIDSTHTVRTGSDVCRLLLDVLPSLRPGVIVHIHDIFWPFELPRYWVEEGRQWAECYLVRAFLTGNTDWEILLFNDYLGRFHGPELHLALPQVLDNPGGALWLRRVS